MNDNQFDNLTREFVKGISRRDTLKLLGAGILSLLFGQYASGQTETEVRAAALCPANNIIEGTCQDLADCKKLGVMCPSGKRSTGSVGCTTTNFKATPNFGQTKTCTDAQKIEFCGIGFTGDCWTRDATAIFTVNTRSDRFTFRPSFEVSGCTDAIKAWEEEIDNHEKQHRQDAMDINQLVSDHWNANNHVLYGCGSNAIADLKAKISAAERELKQLEPIMVAERQRRACVFDDSLEGKTVTDPCQCDACNPGPGISTACGDQCCTKCETCNAETLTCELTCPNCVTCDPKHGYCISKKDCGTPHPLFSVAPAGTCEFYDALTNTCVSTCSACQTCQNGACVDICGAGMHCENGACVTNCTACETYDTATNTCVSTCLDCETCQNGACVPVDCACQGITCDECMHCENGLCVRTCTDTEVCCGNQCINPSEYRCCGPANDGYICPWGTECCAGSRACCDTTEGLCCGGRCVSYGTENCGDCRPCGPGQQCCRGTAGQIYGCANSC